MSKEQNNQNQTQPTTSPESFVVPTNVDRQMVQKVINDLKIIDRRSNSVNPKNLGNRGYFVGVNSEKIEDGKVPFVPKQSNYSEQLTGDVITLLEELRSSHNSPVEHTKLLNRIRSKSYTLKANPKEYLGSAARNIIDHEPPKDLYYSTEHVNNWLHAHHYATMVTTAVAAFVSSTMFGAILPITNPKEAQKAGFFFSAATYGVIQAILKDKVIENTRLDEQETKAEVKPKQNLISKALGKPAKDYDIKHFGKITDIKRFWAAVGGTVGIAGLSAFGHLTHLEPNASEEFYRYERDVIANSINKEAEAENMDFGIYKKTITKLDTELSKPKTEQNPATITELQNQKSELESRSKIFEFYSEQRKLQVEFDRCITVLAEARAKDKTLNTADEIACNNNNRPLH
jgi:cell fate (sporulation/competence/biofilm development) regulator YlbF (YheA/YmcA/DUF963 family)